MYANRQVRILQRLKRARSWKPAYFKKKQIKAVIGEAHTNRIKEMSSKSKNWIRKQNHNPISLMFLSRNAHFLLLCQKSDLTQFDTALHSKS